LKKNIKNAGQMTWHYEFVDTWSILRLCLKSLLQS
jgi:hypothetical protein